MVVCYNLLIRNEYNELISEYLCDYFKVDFNRLLSVYNDGKLDYEILLTDNEYLLVYEVRL